MKHLTTKDAALADARQQIKEAFESRNVAAVTRAFKAERDALAMTPLVQCVGCNQEFEQGDELILCAAAILRKQRQPDGAVTTQWLLERDAKSTASLAWCPSCADKLGVENYINLR